MQLGNAGNDGQPEAAARLAALVQAVEAAEYGFTLVDRDARSAIRYREHDATVVSRNVNADHPTFGCIANSVVNQIAYQHPQPFGLAGDLVVSCCRKVEIYVFYQNLWSKIGTDFFGQPREIDGFRIGQAGFRVEAGEMQHLVDQMGGAGQAALQLVKRAVTFFAVARALGNLQLGLESSKRRTQFVRGIGRETAFSLQGVFDALEQAIERFEQGADFFGSSCRLYRLQLLRVAAGDLESDAIQCSEAASGGEPDPEADQRQAEERGEEQAPGDVADQFVADVVIFADLDL